MKSDDLISRQTAIDGFYEMASDMDHLCTVSDYVSFLKSLPSAQPERKNGEWIVTSEFEDCRYVKCNQCKVTQVFYYNKPLTNFCPNCGADMRGEQDG